MCYTPNAFFVIKQLNRSAWKTNEYTKQLLNPLRTIRENKTAVMFTIRKKLENEYLVQKNNRSCILYYFFLAEDWILDIRVIYHRKTIRYFISYLMTIFLQKKNVYTIHFDTDSFYFWFY